MRKILVLAIALINIHSLSAQNGFKTYSLKQAVEYGVQNNISAKNSKLSEEVAIARNHELLSMGLPQINANFDYQYYAIRPLTPAINKYFNDPNSLTNQVYRYQAFNADGTIKDLGLANLLNNYVTAHKNDKIYFVLPNNINTGVALNQLVYDTRYFIGIQTFKSLKKLSQQTTALTEQEIRYNIIRGYCDVQAAKEIIRVLDSNLIIIQKLLHDTRETYKAGLIEETDVDRLELGESQLKSQINNTKNLFDLGMSALKYNMGLQLTDNIALTDDIETLRKQIQEAAPNTFDPSQRIEEQLLENSILLKTYDKKQRQAGYYPSIYAFGNFGGGSQVSKVKDFFSKQDDGYGGRVSNWFMQSYVGFTIKIPIYDGGQKEASVKQAKLELQKAKNDLENFKTQAALQVEAAKTTFTTNLIEEQNAKESMRLNTKIFNKTRVKFKEGVSSSFELMQTEQDQTMNLIKYYTAVKNVLTSRAELDKALGIK
jgi:outer membrane protein